MQDKEQPESSSDDVVFEEEKENTKSEKIDIVKKLKDELKACRQEREEYLRGWQRMKADSINLKKEEERKREGVGRMAREGVIADILPVLDSFDMAFKDKGAWESVSENWRKGVEYIHSQLMESLKSNGLAEIAPAPGDPFDAAFHVSSDMVSTTDKKDDGTVASVVQKGFMAGGSVMRPARVTVFRYESKKL